MKGGEESSMSSQTVTNQNGKNEVKKVIKPPFRPTKDDTKPLLQDPILRSDPIETEEALLRLPPFPIALLNIFGNHLIEIGLLLGRGVELIHKNSMDHEKENMQMNARVVASANQVKQYTQEVETIRCLSLLSKCGKHSTLVMCGDILKETKMMKLVSSLQEAVLTNKEGANQSTDQSLV